MQSQSLPTIGTIRFVPTLITDTKLLLKRGTGWNKLGGGVDENSKYIVFKTGKFSTYALVYADTPLDGNVDTTITKLGIMIPLSVILILLLGVGCVILLTTRRKNRNEN